MRTAPADRIDFFLANFLAKENMTHDR